MSDIHQLQKSIRQFVNEREWEQFHTPKNLAMALGAETGELLDLFQWLTEEESKNLDNDRLALVVDELADIMTCLLRMFDVLDIEPKKAVMAKLEKNKKKYPIDCSKGNAKKYNRDK